MGETSAQYSPGDDQEIDLNVEVVRIRQDQFGTGNSFSKLDVIEKRQLKVIYSIMAVSGVLAAVAVGIAWAAGDRQLPESGMVTSDCAPCADMGLKILKQEGSAVDAAITTLLCNGVINMHSSGIGGGGFMVVRDHKRDLTTAYNFRPSAPATTKRELYTQDDDTEFGPLAVAIPGEIAGLFMVHKRHGKLKWSEIIKPVADLARNGFGFSEDSHFWITARKNLTEASKKYNGKLYKLLHDENGLLKSPGTVLTRPNYADALDLIATSPTSFYEGSVADDIVSTLYKYNGNKSEGVVSKEDFKKYRAHLSAPLRMNYRDTVLETAPSPAGGPILFHILGILNHAQIPPLDVNDPLTYHKIVEAIKFGYAAFPDNRDFSMDSTDTYQAFIDEIVNATHCEILYNKINDSQTFSPEYYDVHYSSKETHGTSSVSVIDKDDLIVSAISSINNLFGSAVMTDKYDILLNNDMDDFDFPSNDSSRLRTNPNNYVSPGRRPRSSMCPTIFYNKDRKCKRRGGIAGVGGQKIITAIAQYLINIIDFQQTSQQSVDKPRFHHSLLPNILYYEDKFDKNIISSLKKRRHVTEDISREKYLASLSATCKGNVTLYPGADSHRKHGKSAIYPQTDL